MWTRKELKDKAKVSFKANYWKTVLVALIVVVLAGGLGAFSPSSGVSSLMVPHKTSTSYVPDKVNVDVKDGKVAVDVDGKDGETVHVNVDAEGLEDLQDVLDTVSDEDSVHISSGLLGPGMVFAGISLSLIVLIVMAVAIAVYVFVLSPLEVGARRFFVRNLNQRAEVKEVTFGYDNNYKEVVKTLFLRSLFIFLWSLLLIIPGIYKSYQYRMIPYLLADDPTMTKDRAFAESKRMMDGQKWKTFVLDLSFLGWNILSLMTLGILGAFYVGPYQAQTNAALYEKLRYGLPAPVAAAQAAPAASAPYGTAPYGAAPVANDQAQVAQVIVPTSQPPVPPFAEVGAELPGSSDATKQLPDGSETGETPNSPNA